MIHNEIKEFIKILKEYKNILSRQQLKSLRGQAISGNLEVAYKGLETATNVKEKIKSK